MTKGKISDRVAHRLQKIYEDGRAAFATGKKSPHATGSIDHQWFLNGLFDARQEGHGK
jgi:hypothetical protein